MLEPNWLDEVLESLNEERVTQCHPMSPQKKQTGDKITEPETRMNKGSSDYVTPVTRVTAENDSFEKKSADIEETKLERQLDERRKRVLKMLDDRPGIQRAFLTDTQTDPDNIIVSIAIRDQYTFEMLIPRNKYDAFAVLAIIERGTKQ